MKLISADASPFARKVRVLILEADLSEQIEIVPVTTTPLNTNLRSPPPTRWARSPR